MARPIKHSRPTVTIFADASLRQDAQVAGWGGWARSDRDKKIVEGGPAPFSNINVCETWAISLFLRSLFASGYIAPEDKSIMIQSDSLTALGHLLQTLPQAWAAKLRDDGAQIRPVRMKDEVRRPVEEIVELLQGMEVVYLRHVRGHQKGKHTRSYVNEECDKMANEWVKKQLSGEVERAGPAPVKAAIQESPSVITADLPDSDAFDFEFYAFGTKESFAGDGRPGGLGIVATKGLSDKTEFKYANVCVKSLATHIQAATFALGLADRGSKVHIVTHETSLYDGVTDKIDLWRSRNWTKKNGEPIACAEEWQALDKMMRGVDITWTLVRRKSVNPHIKRAAELAEMACLEAEKASRDMEVSQ